MILIGSKIPSQMTTNHLRWDSMKILNLNAMEKKMTMNNLSFMFAEPDPSTKPADAIRYEQGIGDKGCWEVWKQNDGKFGGEFYQYRKIIHKFKDFILGEALVEMKAWKVISHSNWDEDED